MNDMVSARRAPGSRLFWMLWAIDVLVALVFVFFFLIGLVDGSVSSFNMGLWSLTLLVLGSTLLGSYGLHRAGFKGWALVVASVIAIPGILGGLFFLLLILTQTSWN